MDRRRDITGSVNQSGNPLPATSRSTFCDVKGEGCACNRRWERCRHVGCGAERTLWRSADSSGGVRKEGM